MKNRLDYERMESPFNYACIGVCFRFLDNQKPQVLVVKYKTDEHDITGKSKTEVRFPSGTVQFEDIYEAITWFINEKQIFDTTKCIFWVQSKICKLEKVFSEELPTWKTRHEKNDCLNTYLHKAFEELKACKLSSEDLYLIYERSRLITLRREISQETDAYTTEGKFIQASRSQNGHHGIHERCCFATSEVSAPELYKGSGDSDIESSYWEFVEDLEKNPDKKLSQKHQNYMYAAIREAVEQKIHPRVSELKELCGATNH